MTFYVSVADLSAQDNTKLLQQLKSRLKRTISWKEYQWKVKIQTQNPYLDYLIDSSFQGVDRLLILLLSTMWLEQDT